MNRTIADMKSKCTSLYASAELDQLEPSIGEMNALLEKGKRKKTIEKALGIMPVLQSIQEKIEQSTMALRQKTEREKQGAERSLREAEAEGGEVYAGELLNGARELLNEGNILFSQSQCKYNEAIDVYRKSSYDSEKAKEMSRAEKERIVGEEEERRKMEAMKQVEPPPKEEIREWVVSRGDTLWKISAKSEIFNNPFLWPLIFWANRSQIKEPDTVYEGQKLKIPRNMKKEELDEALKKAKSRAVSGLGIY